eukprot:133891-Alexandrium_andersonii.AAC.1
MEQLHGCSQRGEHPWTSSQFSGPAALRPKHPLVLTDTVGGASRVLASSFTAPGSRRRAPDSAGKVLACRKLRHCERNQNG